MYRIGWGKINDFDFDLICVAGILGRAPGGEREAWGGGSGPACQVAKSALHSCLSAFWTGSVGPFYHPSPSPSILHFLLHSSLIFLLAISLFQIDLHATTPLACSFDNSYFLLLPLFFSSSSLLTHLVRVSSLPLVSSLMHFCTWNFVLLSPLISFPLKLLSSKHVTLIIFSLFFFSYAGICLCFQSWLSSFPFLFHSFLF